MMRRRLFYAVLVSNREKERESISDDKSECVQNDWMTGESHKAVRRGRNE